MNARSIKTVYSHLQAKHKQIVLTYGEALVRKLEDYIAKKSLISNATFFDANQFNWVQLLEANWRTIRQELDTVLQQVDRLPNFQDISTDQASITQDDRWKTYFFYAYGYKAEKNCDRCPQTTRLLEQIPDMKTAFFSILLPHKHIPEHQGPYKGLLRYHLALKVPKPDRGCGIQVGNDVHYWQEGKSLIFDDTFPHKAWNDTDDIRVILFLDFVRPMQFPFSLLNRGMIQLIAWSPYVQSGKANFLEWERRLETSYTKLSV